MHFKNYMDWVAMWRRAVKFDSSGWTTLQNVWLCGGGHIYLVEGGGGGSDQSLTLWATLESLSARSGLIEISWRILNHI
jgi:hypothetical protein